MSSPDVIIPVKSESDSREYRIITLANGLQVILCSDPDTQKAAAAMDVNVGSFADPVEALGLAHFLEHMLFLGTEKYPDESSYNATLSKYAGYSNAFTSMEDTCYYFEVAPDRLDEMLDRFAQFFISPLFTASATDREMNAVHSEHQKNLQNDMWRTFQLLKDQVNPEHPMGRFATGSLETLRDGPVAKGINVRNLLIDFHGRYYSSAMMKLAVVGAQPLDKLQEWVEERFAPIKRIPDAAPFEITPDVIRVGTDTGKIVRYVPVKDSRSISLIWQLPPMVKHYRTGVCDFLAFLIGHEGKGSLFSYLRRHGLASALSAGPYFSTAGFTFFNVNVSLTAEGLARYEDVMEKIYAYISLVRSSTSEELRKQYDECAAISAFSFRFKTKEDPSSFASQLSQDMHRAAPADVLRYSWSFLEFNETLTRSLVDLLTPSNAVYMLSAKAFEKSVAFDRTERWYGTRYSRTPISEGVLARLNEPSKAAMEELALPEPNPFLPESFKIVDDVSGAPDAGAGAGKKAASSTTAIDRMLAAATTFPLARTAYTYCTGCDASKGGAPATPEAVAAAVAAIHPPAGADKFKWSDVPPQRVPVPLPADETEPSPFETLAKYRAQAAAAAGCVADEPEGEGEGEIPADAEAEAAAEAAAEAEAEALEAAEAAKDSDAPASPPAPPKLSRAERAAAVDTADTVLPPVELWYKPDRIYNLPKANVTLYVTLPEIVTSAKTTVAANLFTQLVNDAMSEVLYDADVAQLRSSISVHRLTSNIVVDCTGFSDKLPTFVAAIARGIRSHKVDPARFAILKEQTMRSYTNQSHGQAYEIARLHMTMLNSGIYHFNENAAALAALTPESLQDFLDHTLFTRGAITILAQGNVTRAASQAMAREVTSILRLPPMMAGDAVAAGSTQVPAGRTVLVESKHMNPDDDESALYCSYVVGGNIADLKTRAIGSVFDQVSKDLVFTVLRTQQQLGYITYSTFSCAESMSFIFIVQSSRSPMYLNARVEALIEGPLAEAVEKLSDEAFAEYVQAVVTENTQNDNALRDEHYRFRHEISKGNFLFGTHLKVAEEAKALTKADLVAFFNTYIRAGSAQRRKVAVHVFGGDHVVPAIGEPCLDASAPPEDVIRLGVRDIHAFRRRCGVFPMFY